MPANDRRKRQRTSARPARVDDARDARDGAEESDEDAVPRVPGAAYGALLASLGARASDSDVESDEGTSDDDALDDPDGSDDDVGDEDEDEDEGSASEGEEVDAAVASDDEDDEDDDDDDVDNDDVDDGVSDEEESESEGAIDGGGDDGDDEDDDDENEGVLRRRVRLGERLDETTSERLMTQKVTFPRDGSVNGYEAANGLKVPATLDAPAVSQAKLAERWKTVTGSSGFASAKQQEFYSMIASYVDVQHGDRALIADQGAAGQQLNDEILDAVCLHVVDHVTRTRNRVMKNNEALAKKAKAGKKVMEDDLPRDQGFVRPTVLFLTPMRNVAGRAIMRLLDLCPAAHGRNDSVNKLERIEEDFLTYEGSDSDDDVANGDGDGAGKKKKKYKGYVPEDHKVLFKGNTDDHFRLGMKLTKASVRLYVDFFGADIIFASPLGLVTALQDEKSAADFLSAIEILVIDHAHVIQMQNWAHVITIADAMNALPKEMRDCDIQRVHEAHLNGFSKHLRQTILLSAFQTPEQNAFFNRRCVNFQGKVRLKTVHKGVLGQLTIKTRQQFERVHMKAGDVVNADDIRFKYFVKNTLPRIRENPEPGVVIFVSSYFDFVRVRNLLTKEEVSFAVNSEYTEPREAARARTLFADGRKRVLLLTERAHFYFRRRIKAAREICFYSLPEHARFYPELVSYLAGSRAAAGSVVSAQETAHVAGVSVLFSKLDALKLERIVGSARASKMIANSEHPMFLFV